MRYESNDSFKVPNIDLLEEKSPETETVGEEELKLISSRIEHILARYRIKASIVSAIQGPVVTVFRIYLDVMGHKRIANIAKDLASDLEKRAIRVTEDINTTGCIELEIPNEVRRAIALREIIGSRAFQDSPSELTLALGLSGTGQPVVTDLAKAPHILVAGSAGSGKTVSLHSMILSLLFQCSPEDLRLVLIDPKNMEFGAYEAIPHLLTPVVTDAMKAAHALQWCVHELERRYALMKKLGVKNIKAFNEKIEEADELRDSVLNPFSLNSANPEALKRLPYIVIIIDELADLLLMQSKQVEPSILRLTQKGRAAGIHMIVATQRANNDVLSPVIKVNCPTRISFKVENRYDSVAILGESGAEDLLGCGDMLFSRSGFSLERVEGANVTNKEIKKVADFLKAQDKPDYVEGVSEPLEDGELCVLVKKPGSTAEYDSLFEKACYLVLTENRCSISFIQQKLGVGYNRAAKIVEQLEREKIVSAPSPTHQRTVFGRFSQQG